MGSNINLIITVKININILLLYLYHYFLLSHYNYAISNCGKIRIIYGIIQ